MAPVVSTSHHGILYFKCRLVDENNDEKNLFSWTVLNDLSSNKHFILFAL